MSNMKDGDFAGLALLQKNYGLVGVRAKGDKKVIVMINAGSGNPVEAETVTLNQKKVFFKRSVILPIRKIQPISFTV